MTHRHLLAPLCLALVLPGCSDSGDNVAAPEPLLERYTLNSQDSVPEGIAFDAVDRNFYATSLQGGSITRVAADGTESLFRQPDNSVSLGGVKVDEARRLLWVCATDVDGTGDRVWVYDLASGTLENDFSLGALATDGGCNDLVLDDDGNAYVTDPVNPNVYRLDPATGEGEVFATDGRFADITGAGLGLNGIEITPDGDTLIVAKFAPPTLFRVPVPDPREVRAIALSGDSLPSPDGLEFLGGNLYTVANTSVSRVAFNTDFSGGNVVTRDQVSGLSTAAAAEGALYVIKSEVTNWVIGNPLELPFEILKVDLAAFDAPLTPDG
jgi:sugar lactone lactonase YvrE